MRLPVCAEQVLTFHTRAWLSFAPLLRLGTSVTSLVETGEPSVAITHPPLRCRAGRAADPPSDRPPRHAFGRNQNNAGALSQPALRLARAPPPLTPSPPPPPPTIPR